MLNVNSETQILSTFSEDDGLKHIYKKSNNVGREIVVRKTTQDDDVYFRDGFRAYIITNLLKFYGVHSVVSMEGWSVEKDNRIATFMPALQGSLGTLNDAGCPRITQEKAIKNLLSFLIEFNNIINLGFVPKDVMDRNILFDRDGKLYFSDVGLWEFSNTETQLAAISLAQSYKFIPSLTTEQNNFLTHLDVRDVSDNLTNKCTPSYGLSEESRPKVEQPRVRFFKSDDPDALIKGEVTSKIIPALQIYANKMKIYGIRLDQDVGDIIRHLTKRLEGTPYALEVNVTLENQGEQMSKQRRRRPSEEIFSSPGNNDSHQRNSNLRLGKEKKIFNNHSFYKKQQRAHEADKLFLEEKIGFDSFMNDLSIEAGEHIEFYKLLSKEHVLGFLQEHKVSLKLLIERECDTESLAKILSYPYIDEVLEFQNNNKIIDFIHKNVLSQKNIGAILKLSEVLYDSYFNGIQFCENPEGYTKIQIEDLSRLDFFEV